MTTPKVHRLDAKPNLTSSPRGGHVCTPDQSGRAHEIQGMSCTEPPLDVAGAAVYLGVNERYVRLLIAERRVAFLKLGRLVRFHKRDLDAYLDSCRVEVPTRKYR